MAYDRLDPIEGESGWESTLVTKMSVKQLMEREGAFQDLTLRAQKIPTQFARKEPEAPVAPEEVVAASPLRQPPHMLGPVAVTVPGKPKQAPVDQIAHAQTRAPEEVTQKPEAAPQVSESSRSFISKLFGR
ncbi:MAG: hypothetical protein AAGF13_03815 [Pseudomonadota bacterium]